MITFKMLRSRLAEATCEPVDIYDFMEEWFNLFEDSTFYIYKVSTGAVLATNIQGFEAAKRKSSELRQSLGLKWDDINLNLNAPEPKGLLVSAAVGTNLLIIVVNAIPFNILVITIPASVQNFLDTTIKAVTGMT